MPSSIVQGIADVILQALLEFACYYIGRIFVLLISFGRWKCYRILAGTPRRKLRVAGIYHLRGKHVYLTAEATQLVGLIALFIIGGGAVLIWYLKKC
jgi:hypothetical protein